jgi:hypothetical protein
MLWRQQIITLLLKRLTIFSRRYILACVTFLLPLVLQLLLVLHASLTTVSHTTTHARSPPAPLRLSLETYGALRQHVPIHIAGFNRTTEQHMRQIAQVSDPTRFTWIRDRSVLDYASQQQQKGHNNIDVLVNDANLPIIGIDITGSSSRTGAIDITAYYNRLAFHSSAIALGQVSNLLLSACTTSKTHRITTYNAPFALTTNATETTDSTNARHFAKYIECFDLLPGSRVAFVTSAVCALIIALRVMHVRNEAHTGSFCAQRVANVHQLAYWLANYAFDWTLCACTLLTIGLALYSFSADAIAADTCIWLAILLVVSSTSWPLYAYCTSHVLSTRSETGAFIIMLGIFGMAPLVDMLLYFIAVFVRLSTSVSTVSAWIDNATDQQLTDRAFDSNDIVQFARTVLCIIMPNVTIKRAIYAIRLHHTPHCVECINTFLNGKQTY